MRQKHGNATRHPTAAAPPVPVQPRNYRAGVFAPCKHLGEPTGETRDCMVCGGKKQIPLRLCATHGKCTDDKQLVYREGGSVVQVAWCRMCKEYAPQE